MKIYFKCQDESETVANSPALALFYWHAGQVRGYWDAPPDLLPLTLYTSGRTLPGPNHPSFLSGVIAAIERKWNKTPEMTLPPPDLDAACWYILKWLKDNGDITEITVT